MSLQMLFGRLKVKVTHSWQFYGEQAVVFAQGLI
jgi:hypothetical protein